MSDFIFTMLSYPFMMRAFIVGILIALCSSLLGVSLVLKRYSMIGDGLSHVAFSSFAIAMVFNFAPLTFTIPVVICAAFLLLRISFNTGINGDAATAIICSSALAIGITIASLTTGLNTDINNFLFGSILALSNKDVILSVILSIIVLSLFVIFYNKLFAITFDEQFARSCGTNVQAYNMLLAFLTAITIVLGMRMMGALLISGLIVFPALTSMRFCHHFRQTIICSSIISIFCLTVGLILSYLFATPTGASVILINLFIFLIAFIISHYNKK